MAARENTFYQRNKYKINGLVLLLPIYFLYQSLFPVFPDPLPSKRIGAYEVTPTPYNLEPPYQHDGHYTKDFMLTFSQGNIHNIRQAYLNIGKSALPLAVLSTGDEGILHGSQHGQEVHAIAPISFNSEHKIWLTIEDWQGQIYTTHWPLPDSFI